MNIRTTPQEKLDDLDIPVLRSDVKGSVSPPIALGKAGPAFQCPGDFPGFNRFSKTKKIKQGWL